MFDISFWELAVIGVVALVVIGPEKLPGIARTAGVWVAKARRMIASAKADINRELQTDELKKLLTEQKEEMQELRQIIGETRSDMESEIKQLTTELDASATATSASPQIATTGALPSVPDHTTPENPGAKLASSHGDTR
jgi:sec-independent protein translocase protein TatB